MKKASSLRCVLGAVAGAVFGCMMAGIGLAQTQLPRSTLSNAGGVAATASSRLTSVVGQSIIGQAPGVQAGFLFSNGGRTGTAAADAVPLPKAFRFGDAWPNPFQDRATQELDLPEAGHVRVTVFDLLGRPVAVLTDRHYAPGTHALVWEPETSTASSGYYLVRVQAGTFIRTRLLVRIR